MRALSGIIFPVLSSAALSSAALVSPALADAPQRIASIGGAATEFAFALGAGDRLVARDTTSVYPPEAMALPDVGYMRQLSAEGVLSVAPDLILLQEGAGPPETIAQLKAANIPLVALEGGFGEAQILDNIRIMGEALDRREAAAQLLKTEKAAFATLAADVETGAHPKVMFVMSGQSGRLMVAGRDTGADGILALAGARNVMGEAFEGYRILSDEAILTAAPDIIMMMDRTGHAQVDSSAQDLWANPAFAGTPAGRKQALVRVAPSALAFGPRTAQLATQLRADLLAAYGG